MAGHNTAVRASWGGKRRASSKAHRGAGGMGGTAYKRTSGSERGSSQEQRWNEGGGVCIGDGSCCAHGKVASITERCRETSRRDSARGDRGGRSVREVDVSEQGGCLPYQEPANDMCMHSTKVARGQDQVAAC